MECASNISHALTLFGVARFHIISVISLLCANSLASVIKMIFESARGLRGRRDATIVTSVHRESLIHVYSIGVKMRYKRINFRKYPTRGGNKIPRKYLKRNMRISTIAATCAEWRNLRLEKGEPFVSKQAILSKHPASKQRVAPDTR